MRQRCIREQAAQLCILRQLRTEARDFVAHKRIDRRAKQLVRLVEECTSFGAVPTRPR